MRHTVQLPSSYRVAAKSIYRCQALLRVAAAGRFLASPYPSLFTLPCFDVQHMLAGAVAGIAEHLAMYPVDTIKTRMQALAHPGQRVCRSICTEFQP